MMTTLAATMGALPIALGHGAGAELRQPLGVAVVGGLMVSNCSRFTSPRLFIFIWIACLPWFDPGEVRCERNPPGAWRSRANSLKMPPDGSGISSTPRGPCSSR